MARDLGTNVDTAGALSAVDKKSASAAATVRLVYRLLEPRMVFDAAVMATLAEALQSETPPSDAAAVLAATPTADLLAALKAPIGQMGIVCVMPTVAPVTDPKVTSADILPGPSTNDIARGRVCVMPTVTPVSDPPVAPTDDGADHPTTDVVRVDVCITQTVAADVSPGTKSIVFVDPRVVDSEAIIRTIAPGTEIVMLNAETDGLDQIAAYLAGHDHDIASIHILSHGASGELQLGGARITGDTLLAHQADLAAIGRALKPGGDILIYGCDVAAGATGQQFVGDIARMTGDDVAASSDATGASALGGNWVLETKSGTIETETIAASDWAHVLAVTANNDTAAITATIPPAANPTVSGNVVTNDTTTGTTKTVTQVHGFDTKVGQSLTTAYGSIVMNANGTYTYTADNSNSTVRGLSGTQSITDIIGYTVKDSTGAIDYAYLTVTVTGVSETPIAFDNYNTVTAVGTPSASGNILTDSDGVGIDTIDRPVSQFVWETLYANGANVAGTKTVDGVTVTITTSAMAAADGTNSRTVSTGTQGGHTGYFNWALDPAKNPYVAPTTTFAFSQPVINLEFSLNDLDIAGAPTGTPATTNWQDKVIITGTRTVGGIVIPVTFTAQMSGRLVQVGANGFEGLGETGYINVNAADTDGNVHLIFDSPVDNVVITFTDGSLAATGTGANPANHVIGMTDMSWQNPNTPFVVTVNSTTIAATGTTSVVGTYGTLVIASSGSYTYTVDNNNPAVKALPAGATLTENFNYGIKDLAGLTTSAVLHITVNGINDAPAGADNTVTVVEDTPYTFSAASFGFSDTVDSPADSLESVVITTLPSAADGVIKLNGSAIVAGQDIAVADLANLTFTPASNKTGSGIGQFTFQVRDTGGIADGGVDLDPIANIFKFNVTALNDAPVTAGPASQTVNEDTQLVFSTANGNALTISDVDAGTTGLETVTLSVTNGTLILGSTASLTGLTGNGSGSVTFTGTVAQVNAAIAGVKYQGNLNFNGSDTLSISVADDGKDLGVATSNGVQAAAIKTVAITVSAVNDAPFATNDIGSTYEDSAVTFTAATLLANDTDVDAGDTKSIVSVQSATNGSVTLVSGNPVFTPSANFVGTASFTYTMKDAAGLTSTATVTITVNPVNDAPIGADATRTTDEDTPYTFAAADFAMPDPSDTPANSLQAIVVATLPSSADGVLKFDGVAVNLGDVIPAGSLGRLTFTPAADKNGTGLGAFTFRVQDNGGTANGGVDTAAAANTFKFNVSAIADVVPDVIAVLEDTPITFNVLTGSAGADTFEGAPQVTSVTQPVGGAVTFAADGTMTFTPNGNFNGTTTFNYTVTSGDVTETTTVTLNVAPIDDAPVSTVPAAQTVAEDTQLVFSSGNGNLIVISDVDAGAAGVETVTLSVAHGTLILGSTAGITGLTGNGTGTVSFTGAIAQVNAAIAGLKYQGGLNYNGGDTLTIAITDDGKDNGTTTSNGAQSAAIKTVTINVTPVNDPPFANTDPVAVTEDTPITIPASTLLANDTDLDGDTLTITSVQGATNGTVALVNGSPVFTPNGNYFGPASFTYTITDGTSTSTATVNLTIAPVNDAPVALNDGYATGEKTTLVVPLATSLLNNDTDVDTTHASLIVSQINGSALVPGAPIMLPTGAILTQNADGTFSYNPNGAFNTLVAGQTTTDQFTYQVSDGQGGLATATATITITGVNDGPLAIADTNSTSPRVVLTTTAAQGVLTNDTDLDTPHASLVVSAVGGSGAAVGLPVAGSNGGMFTVNANGSYSFDPGTAFDTQPAGSSATTSITYTVSDGQGGISTTTLTISVPYQNLPPYVAVAPLAQTSQDGNAVSIPLSGLFSDPNPQDQGNLTITATGLPPGLSVNAAGVIVGTLTSDASQHAGPYVVTVTAKDPSGSQISTTFNFSVGNPAPTATSDINTVGEHATTTGKVTANDVDGGADDDVLTVTQINGAAYTPGSVVTLSSGAQLVMAADGSYSYDPHSAFNGLALGAAATDSFTYQVSDGQGGFATATAVITINGQNDTPVVVDPANPGIPPANPNTIIPAQAGQDGTGITPLAVKSFFKDPDNGDTLTLSVTGALPAGMTFNATTGTFSGTPSATASQGGPANNGVYAVLVNADDGHGGVVSTTVTFTISNPAPIAVNDTNTVNEHETTAGDVVANDHDGGGDGDALTVTAVNGQTLVPGATITLPSGAHLVMQANGIYSYDPAGAFASLQANQTATETFTYIVSDGQGGTSLATATIVIQGQDDAPLATADTNVTRPQVAISVDAAHGVLSNDTDVEHDALSVTNVTNDTTSVAPGGSIVGTNGGTFVIAADGSYTFDPGTAFDNLAPGASGQTSVTYSISDGHGGTSSTTLTITVPFTNLPPVVQQPISTQNATDGSPVSIPLGGVFGDPNPGDVVTIEATGLPPGLMYNPLTGAIEGTLTPDASQHGGTPYTVTLTATDPSGSMVTSTFTFNVSNPAPIAGNDINTVAEHDAITGATAITNDHDGALDTDTLTVSLINGQAYTTGGTITLPSGALLVMNANGTYSYDPNGTFNGLSVGQSSVDAFTYQVSDGQGGVADATVTITITGQNEAPVIVDPLNPGTPLDPDHVVPAQTGQDGTAIVSLNVTPFFADADTADSLTLSVPSTELPPGITFDSATGTFSGTPTSVASQGGNAGPGVYDVTVTANDGHGGTVTTVVRFTITNPAPAAIDDSNSVAEHGTITGALSILGNDHDGGTDGDPLSVSQVNGVAVTSGATIVLPSGALLVMSTNGTYDYNPNGAFAHLQVGQSVTDSFVYQVSDGQGGFGTARVTIIVTGENDAPTANGDTNAGVAGGTIAVVAPLGVLSNDTDPEHDLLAVTGITNGTTTVAPGAAITGTAGGTFVINADGSYTFDTGHAFDGLQPGTQASTSVTYTISDGHGGTSLTTLTITVPFSDLPPVVNQPVQGQSSTDGSPINIDVTNVFKDPNPGDVLTIVASGLPPGLSLVNGHIVGTLAPDASQTGPYVVTLKATDPTGHVVTSTFNFNVDNPTPTAGNDVNTVTEHGTITGATVISNDHDGGTDSDLLTVTLINGATFTPGSTITLASGATLVMQSDGTYAYNPTGAFNGLALGESAADSFTYQISDGQGGTSTATVAITINGENDTPVVLDPAHPGDPVAPGTQVIPTQPARDGSPITPLNVTSVFGDPDKTDTLTLSVNPTELPPGITFDPNTGTFSGTVDPSASQGGPSNNGTYPIVVTASDGHGGTISTVVVFTIGNPAPVAAADTNSVTEHGTITGAVSLLGNDHDGGSDTDPLHVSQVNGVALIPGAIITLPSGALLVMNANGTYDYNPNGTFNGLSQTETATDTFSYQVSDGQGGFDTATGVITIIGENDTPIVIDPITGLQPTDPVHVVPAQSGYDGSPITPLNVTSFFKDPDTSDTITLSVSSLPPGITFDPATGTFSGTPTAAASQGGPNGDGTYAVTVTATDSHGATVTTIVTFSIGNATPTATSDVAAVQEHGTTTGSVLTNDRDGGGDTDPLKVTQVNGQPNAVGHPITLPSGAILTLNADGTYIYNPNGVFVSLAVGEPGTDTFSYQISDGQGGFATATVTITVVGENDTPVIVDPTHPGQPVSDPNHVVAPVTGLDGTPIAPLSVADVFRDPDGSDTLTLSVDPTTLPPGIAFDPVTGTFTGVPASTASVGGPNGDGVYVVTVAASDGHGGTVATLVTFTFTNVPPGATDDHTFTQPGDPVVISVLANDRDGGQDGDPLTVISATPSTGTVTINPDGTLTFIPTPGYVGLATITYTISDGQGGTSTATAFVLVTPNIHPTAPSVDVPPSIEAGLPANTGITAEGAVLSTVHGVEPLSALPPGNGGLKTSGIVVAAANGISPLGSSTSALDPRVLNPVWRLQQMIGTEYGRSQDTWNPEGLTGFSLRYTFATDVDQGKAQIVLDSMVRDRTLIVNLSSTALPDHASVVEYKVVQANGKPLPAWLDRAGPSVLIGERPVDVEAIRLRIIALLSDGTTVERDVEIQTVSGEIKPYTAKHVAVVPLFSDQLRTQTEQDGSDIESLLKALAR